MTPEPLSMPDLISIRRYLDSGSSISWVARKFDLAYHRVWRIQTRRSFADVPWPQRDASVTDHRDEWEKGPES